MCIQWPVPHKTFETDQLILDIQKIMLPSVFLNRTSSKLVDALIHRKLLITLGQRVSECFKEPPLSHGIIASLIYIILNISKSMFACSG